MRSVKTPDLARLYQLNSSNTRSVAPDFSVDPDRRPLRFRTYPASERTPLPGRDFRIAEPLGEVLARRRSVREFDLSPLPLDTVGRLLHASYGVVGLRQVESEWTFARPAPSAGGLYPLELYVAAQQVSGLENGIYHYDARAHELELRRRGRFHRALADMTIGQDMIQDANLVVLIAAQFQRTMWKYGQRGFRYVWLDAGHLAQNLYLVATALRLGAVAIGGFYDAEVTRLAELPPDEEVIYVVCVGTPRAVPAAR